MSNGETRDDALFEQLRIARRGTRKQDCPLEERFRFFAVGLTDPSESQELLEHATNCDYCGPLLREAVQDLGSAPSREEIDFAATTRLANPRRRRAFAEQLAGHHPPPPIFKRLIWLAPATVMAGLAIFFIQPQYAVWSAERLTNDAYTARRTFAMRFPGAGHAPVQGVEMGSETSGLSHPPEFYAAKAKIDRGLAAHPNNPRWQRLQGEADLLENRQDVAISELEHARSLHPRDPYILSDLGIAYYQKGQKGDDPYYVKAYQAISEALRLKPDDSVLLFNRALAAGQLHDANSERAAWEAYLRVDSSSEWAGEARQHLAQH